MLAVLLVGYAAVFVRLPSFASSTAFEPLSPRGREVERAIEERRFADALPLAQELVRAFPDEPLIAYWLAEIYQGLERPRDEAAAWERVLEQTTLADAACPALPLAYAGIPDVPRSLEAYERCATLAPDVAERWFELGEAYASNNRPDEATRAFTRARTLDPTDPRLAGARAGQ